ncbi:TPA: hypothetical protein U3P49_000998, partial [Streptococcus agalactiae]|nr:hypothetical protein [Streptococcus agalactiae]
MILYHRFGTIRNSTALKRKKWQNGQLLSFGTIRNSTALKRRLYITTKTICFGTIRNSTALKLIAASVAFPE